MNNTLNINRLPVPTWNRLKVNSAAVSCPLELHQENSGLKVSGADAPGMKFIKNASPSESLMTSALGEEADGYVEKHASERLSLTITGKHPDESPVVLSYTLKNSDLAAVLDIYAEEGSQAAIVLCCRSEGEAGGFQGNLVRLHAGDNSSIRLIQIQMLGNEWTSLDNVAVLCGEQAEVMVTQIELGSAAAFSGCYAALNGYESKADIRCYYMGNRSQTLDFNYVVRHQAKKSRSTINAHGILMDQSRKILRGTIDFPTGCAQSVGSEMETVLLLSPGVKNLTVPLILCTEEDVEGSHGATIGNLSEDQMFYLKCRGFTEGDIRVLLAKSLTEIVCKEALLADLGEEVRQFTADYLKEGGDE